MSNPILSNDVSLLLDENMSPNIVPRLNEAGIDAVHVRDRGLLRKSDYQLLKYAADEHRAVATINIVDFAKLVTTRPFHHGIAVIPNGGNRNEQFEYLMTLVSFLRAAPPAMEGLRNRIVSVDENKMVTARWACSVPPIDALAESSSACLGTATLAAGEQIERL